MLLRLTLAELRHRPGRALFLLAGYSLGVSVMVVLLAVGEAMLEQARDQALIGGGDVVLVPQGISTEMLRAGGATSLFFGIDRARFVHRQMLESPRGRENYGVVAASPIIDGRIVEIEHAGALVQAVATGEIPSRAAAAGATPDLIAGAWADSPADRTWVDPAPDELYDAIDGFHLPRGAAAGDSTWAEWHYFNVVLSPERWLYLTYLIGGRVGVPGEWGARLLLTVREPDGEHRAVTRDFADREVAFDTLSPDLRLGGEETSVRQEDGVYHVRARLGQESIDLRLRPSPHRYFPPAELGTDSLPSGYVVPALHAAATGRVCLPDCVQIDSARAYHDHNWGVWRNVTWDWGTASNASLSLLYGAVYAPELPSQGIFAYLVDDRGARGLFRPREVVTLTERELTVDGVTLRAPTRLRFTDERSGLDVVIDVSATHATRMEDEIWFLQMRGAADVNQRGYPPERLEGFFETYVRGAVPSP